MRLREPLQAAAPCAEGVAEIHADPDEYDPLDEANDMQLQVLLWEAAGRIRLEPRGEDGRLDVVPNEEAQRELEEIDARNARAAANVVEPAAEARRSRTRSGTRSRSRRRRRGQRRRDRRRRRSSSS